MQDTQTIIILLVIIVSILSILAILALVFLISILVKARRIVKHVDETTLKITEVVEWLSPSKLVKEIIGMFNKN